MISVREALETMIKGEDLTREQAASLMTQLLDGELTGAQVGALLLGLRVKGESAEEIAAFAGVLRPLSHQVKAPAGAVDTCGTGGDGGGTFNISTTAAFVVAGAGVPVAKHGNRFASGRCGSADVLEQLGVPLNLAPTASEELLAEYGIAFLYAPLYHPALAKVAIHRRELGVRTIFNLLGPLLNPAATPHQLLGVASAGLLPKMAHALALLGSKRSVVVHGGDGLDEVTLSRETQAILVDDGQLTPLTIVPEEYGLGCCSRADLQGGTPGENAAITLSILQGESGPRRDCVLLNAAVALFAAGRAADIREGLVLARESLDSGRALGKLEALRRAFPSAAAL